jgi:hypothetical protein
MDKEKIKQKIKRFAEKYLKIFFIEHKIFLFFLLYFIVSLIFSWVFTNFSYKLLIDIPQFNFSKILLFLIWLFICIYLYLDYIIIEKINKNQSLIVILGVLITIFLFSFQQVLNEKKLFIEQLAFLKEDNNRNNYHIKSIFTDIKNNPYVIFWRNFYTDNYKEYWDYISSNYSQNCKDLYADLTMRFDILNNIIKTRNDLLIKPGFIQMDISKLNGVVSEAASSTMPVLDEIINKCQG